MNITQGLLQIKQVGDTIAQQMGDIANEVVKEELNLLDLTLKGGWIMIPIFIMSVISVYIFIERFMTIQRAAKEDSSFMSEIKNYITQGKVNEAMALCKSNQSTIARMIEKGISRIGRPLPDINAAVENVGKLEVAKLEKGLPTLATISGAGPMIGFLGTVMGMIVAFYDMANVEGGNLNVSVLSNGIYTAMVTTVAGLIVGITAYLGYNILVSKVDKVVYQLELRTTQFMDLLNEPI